MGDLEPAILAIVSKLSTGGGDATAANQIIIIADVADLITRTKGLDEIYDITAAIPTTAMRGTENAALASEWTAALATILGNFSAARIGYLDELAAANLPADIAAIPTTAMRGTENAALASEWTAALATILGNFTATRIGYLDELAAANLPADIDTINNTIAEVNDIVIYPAAEDRATSELDGDGSTPNHLAESSQSNADEAAGMASPAWTEDINFEQNGTITIISIYAELRWAQKQTGGGTSSAKMQVSGDGGSTWVDLTDNVTEAGVAYADKTRVGVGRWITTITPGANQLQLRLCQWGGTTSAQVKLREDSYLRITHRKA